MIYAYCDDNKYKDIKNLQEAVLWLDTAAKGGYIDCYFRLGEIYASGNNKYPGIKQDFNISKKFFKYARDESNLSKNIKDKLSENIWNAILNNPLHSVNLMDNYQNIIGAKWTGQYINDLDPDKLRQMSQR